MNKISYNEVYMIIYSINSCIMLCTINLLWVNVNSNNMLTPGGKNDDVRDVEIYSLSTVEET